jgi:hypothetical protein
MSGFVDETELNQQVLSFCALLSLKARYLADMAAGKLDLLCSILSETWTDCSTNPSGTPAKSTRVTKIAGTDAVIGQQERRNNTTRRVSC